MARTKGASFAAGDNAPVSRGRCLNIQSEALPTERSQASATGQVLDPNPARKVADWNSKRNIQPLASNGGQQRLALGGRD